MRRETLSQGRARQENLDQRRRTVLISGRHALDREQDCFLRNGVAGSALADGGKGLKLVSSLATMLTASGRKTVRIALSSYCTVPRARSDGCTPSKSRRVRNPPRRRRSRIEGAMVKLQISVRAIAGAIGGTFIMFARRFVTRSRTTKDSARGKRKIREGESRQYIRPVKTTGTV